MKRNDWLFWDIDTQVDFIHPDGKLYVPTAETLTENLERLTTTALAEGVPIFASADDHELADDEISEQPDFQDTFPPHCMRGTAGAARIAETTVAGARALGPSAIPAEEIAALLDDRPAVIFLKKTFDVFSNPNTEKLLDALDPARVVVYGVALDICNRYAVEGLLARNRRVTLITDATAAIDSHRGENLLRSWSDRGVELMTCDDFLAENFQTARVEASP
ncbi:MAG: cysteine hydrolase family protein [Acidobacteriota bacterium]